MRFLIRRSVAIATIATAAISSPTLAQTERADFHPSLSADGRTLVYYSYRGGDPDLFLKDLRTGTERNLSQTSDLWEVEPHLSPDGCRIAFSRGPSMAELDVVVLDLDTGEEVIAGRGVGVTWSRDGTRLAWMKDWELWTAKADGTEAPHLIELGLEGLASDPAWTPDGSGLVFVHQVEEGGPATFRRVDLATAEITLVFDGDGATLASPSFSPDGNTLVFSLAPPNSRGATYELDLMSHSLSLLLHPQGGFQYFPRAAANGSVVVEMGIWNPRAFSIYLIPADGSEAKAVTGPDVESPPAPREVALPGERLFPEGVAIDSDNGDLYVGGAGNGRVLRVRNGVPLPFFGNGVDNSPDDIASVLGLAVDSERDRLFVTSTPFVEDGAMAVGPGSLPEVLVVDTESGEVLARLSPSNDGLPHFFNDVDVADDGTAYVTDSMSPIVWRIDSGLREITPWVRSDDFQRQPGFNLNGVAVHPTGSHIYVSSIGQAGALWRIDRDGGAPEIVEITGPFFGADGLEFVGETLLGIARGPIAIKLDASGLSGSIRSISSPSLDLPTTLAWYAGELWITNAQMDHYVTPMFGDQGPPDLPFKLTVVPFPGG